MLFPLILLCNNNHHIAAATLSFLAAASSAPHASLPRPCADVSTEALVELMMMVRQQDQHQCFTEVHGLVDAASKPQQQQSNSGQEQLMHMRSTAVSALPSRVRNWAGTWQQPCGNSSNNGSG